MYENNAEEINAVIQSQDIIEKTNELSAFVNNETIGIEISPLAIYCHKTGHVIAMRESNTLFAFMKIRDKDEFVWSLFNATSLCVHPAWIDTNGEDLDLLIEADPVGYACYCLGLITAEFYQNAKNTNPKLMDCAERYWALARANALITQRGAAGLAELNHELCRFLTYAKGAKGTEKYLFKRAQEMASTPDMLAMLHVSGELTELLHECTNRVLNSIGFADRYIHATRFIDFAATPADAARGPSNIRAQKVSKRDVKEQGMFGELKKLFDDAGLEGLGVFQNKSASDYRKGTRADFSRFAAAHEDTEAKMIADLAAFGGTNLDIFGAADDGEDDDNEVIVIHPTPQEQINDASMEDLSLIEANEIAADIIEEMQNPVEPVMQEIAREVLAVINTASVPEIVEIVKQKPMSALERARAARGK